MEEQTVDGNWLASGIASSEECENMKRRMIHEFKNSEKYMELKKRFRRFIKGSKFLRGKMDKKTRLLNIQKELYESEEMKMLQHEISMKMKEGIEEGKRIVNNHYENRLKGGGNKVDHRVESELPEFGVKTELDPSKLDTPHHNPLPIPRNDSFTHTVGIHDHPNQQSVRDPNEELPSTVGKKRKREKEEDFEFQNGREDIRKRRKKE